MKDPRLMELIAVGLQRIRDRRAAAARAGTPLLTMGARRALAYMQAGWELYTRPSAMADLQAWVLGQDTDRAYYHYA